MAHNRLWWPPPGVDGFDSTQKDKIHEELMDDTYKVDDTYQELLDATKEAEDGTESQKQEKEYSGPKNRWGKPKGTTLRGNKAFPRNEPCPCGSGKKFKRCCIYTK